MLRFKIALAVALVFAGAMAEATNTIISAATPAVAQQILDKLYLAAGQYAIKKPGLEMTKENMKVAAYYPARNVIVLDEKTYLLCRSLGKDSSQALAFVLGHELSHAFQKELGKTKSGTNFLSYDQTYKVDTRTEKTADINGVFTAFLAGYRLSGVVPKLLPKLYEAYGLTGRTLRGYPSLEERSQSAKEVLEITDELIDLYETSSYLLAAGYYDLAATNYEYILQYYQGREVHNNLGVLYLYQAMEHYLPQTDRFVYPIEIDAATQLKKIDKARGPQELSMQEKLVRMQLLNKASNHFMQAISLDKNYLTAKLNYVCALGLQQKPKDALAYFQKKKLQKAASKSKAEAEKFKLVEAILSALMNDKLGAEAGFHDLLKSKNQPVAVAARYNLNVVQNKVIVMLPEHEFEFPERFKTMMKNVKLGRISQVEPLVLNEKGDLVRHLTEGSTDTFSFGNKRGNVLSIIRFKNKMAEGFKLEELTESLDQSFFYNLVSTTTGYFLTSEKDGIIIKVTNDGKVEEMAKVVKH